MYQDSSRVQFEGSTPFDWYMEWLEALLRMDLGFWCGKSYISWTLPSCSRAKGMFTICTNCERFSCFHVCLQKWNAFVAREHGWEASPWYKKPIAIHRWSRRWSISHLDTRLLPTRPLCVGASLFTSISEVALLDEINERGRTPFWYVKQIEAAAMLEPASSRVQTFGSSISRTEGVHSQGKNQRAPCDSYQILVAHVL